MGRHEFEPPAGLGSGPRVPVVLGAVGLAAIGLVFGTWWLLSSGPSISKGATAMTTARATFNAVGDSTAESARTTETFVVPTPTFSTSPLSVPLGSVEPEIPGDSPQAAGPPPPPPLSSSSSTTRSSSSTTGPNVRNLTLSCNAQGKRVRAWLTFTSSGTVPVTLTAGDKSVNTMATGTVRLDAIGMAPAQGTATCSARVNGVPLGPIQAH